MAILTISTQDLSCLYDMCGNTEASKIMNYTLQDAIIQTYQEEMDNRIDELMSMLSHHAKTTLSDILEPVAYKYKMAEDKDYAFIDLIFRLQGELAPE